MKKPLLGRWCSAPPRSGRCRCAGTAAIAQTIAGTRLDISATGEVTRVPDLAIISAGVVTRSATASGAHSGKCGAGWSGCAPR